MSDDRYPDHQTDAASLGTAAIGPLAPAGRATWEAIAELASVVPPDRWAVVGGQMVEIHAALAGVEPHRTTDDGDIAVDVRAHGRQAMRQVAAAFISAGFDTTFSPSGVTRFQHGLAKIDLLAPEGVGADVETVPPGHAVQAPGATQALERSLPVAITWDDRLVEVRVPSLLGAIIAKAAGSAEIASLAPDERVKHQRDLTFLLSLAARGDMRAMASEMSKRDRKRLTVAVAPMVADRAHRGWRGALVVDDANAAIQRLAAE